MQSRCERRLGDKLSSGHYCSTTIGSNGKKEASAATHAYLVAPNSGPQVASCCFRNIVAFGLAWIIVIYIQSLVDILNQQGIWHVRVCQILAHDLSFWRDKQRKSQILIKKLQHNHTHIHTQKITKIRFTSPNKPLPQPIHSNSSMDY